MNYKIVKRIIDVVLSSTLLVILSPFLVVVSIILKLESDGPLIYKQERAGYKGRAFNIYKFRTMAKDNDVHNFNEKDKVTKLGQIIRPLGIDELPQLFNILKGEMSLIGPRPYLTKYTDYYTEEQKIRLDVCPGLFGPAACIGHKITILDSIDVDVEYVKNMSFKQDVNVVGKLLFNYVSIVAYRKQSSFGNKENIKENYQSLIDNFNNHKEEIHQKDYLQTYEVQPNTIDKQNDYYESADQMFMLQSIEESNNRGNKTLVKKLPHIQIFR